MIIAFLEEFEEPLYRAVYDSFYSNKVKDKKERKATHTYNLNEAKILWKRQNEAKKR